MSGAILVVPDNMAAALSGNPLVGSITAVVTAISDPFIGMIAGILARMVMGRKEKSIMSKFSGGLAFM